MAGSFDAVVTCFFIDTAHNILEYLEVIHRCEERKGGCSFCPEVAVAAYVLSLTCLGYIGV
jgi:radical SAM superfamily enzyme with C-terminal helix-hairpin-helix motif